MPASQERRLQRENLGAQERGKFAELDEKRGWWTQDGFPWGMMEVVQEV